ncbi:MAG: hypothetical protein ACM3H8_05430, partial [Sphingobacteriales bacterium]
NDNNKSITQSQEEEKAQDEMVVDTSVYYTILNQSNGASLIADPPSETEPAFAYIKGLGKHSFTDNEMFVLNLIAPDTYVIISKQSGGILSVNENENGYVYIQVIKADTNTDHQWLPSQTFGIRQKKDGLFQIDVLMKEKMGQVIGIDTSQHEWGQYTILVNNDESLSTQWQLMPTNVKVN